MLVSVYVVVLTFHDGDLNVLLAPCPESPDTWELPGGHLEPAKTPEYSAKATLRAALRSDPAFLEQLYTFGATERNRGPREIALCYLALLPSGDEPPERRATAAGWRWHSMFGLPERLKDDHDLILGYALDRLRNKLEYTSAGFRLLPEKFTFPELQRMYEVVLERSLDKRNFRKRVLNLGILEPLEEFRPSPSRPARLYKFMEERFFPLKEKGILFPLR